MIDFLSDLSAWHWYVLGGLLLAAETVGAAGFLLGMAIAALLTGLLTHLGLEWQWQLLSFAVLSVVSSVLYWSKFRGFNQDTDRPDLNNRSAEQVGHQGVVVVDSESGVVKAKLGDTLWQMRCDEACQDGDHVRVIAVEGAVLQVEKV